MTPLTQARRFSPFPFVLVALGAAASMFNPAEAEAQRTSMVDSAGVSIVTSDPFSSDRRCTVGAEPFFSLGDALGDERYEFYTLRGMARLSDGSVAVIDRRDQRVRVFSESGEFLRSMGGRGEGPGEFRNPWFLWALPGDTLWVGDYRPQRFNVFSPDGEFIRLVTPDPFYLNPSHGGGVLSNGHSINTRDDGRDRDDFRTPRDYVIEAHRADGALVRELMTLPGRRFGRVEEAPNFLLDPLFDGRPSVDANGTTIAVTAGRHPEVRLLDERLRLRRIIRWIDEDREVTRADVRAWREEYVRQQRERDLGNLAETLRPQMAALLSDERPVADRFPAASSVRVGRDGRIWVRRYPRPRETTGWLAFEPDGDFFCHLDPVPGLQVYEIGADYILGSRRDELDIESVVMYELIPPDSASPRRR
ncbi:6-bladed beta-propeller [Candidatus Palauibacter sp.]|uniref:6-bladed beta-propeller n=1 Tax=Candidatus Palauibacter sp. TaxID=3101350 RepID=UPI003B58F4A2